MKAITTSNTEIEIINPEEAQSVIDRHLDKKNYLLVINCPYDQQHGHLRCESMLLPWEEEVQKIVDNEEKTIYEINT